MIDYLYSIYSRRREKPLDSKYKPTDAIQNERLINPGADKLAVIFPGWHTHNFPINILAKRLTRRGWAVLFYDFHDQIMEPDEEVVVESLKYIQDYVCNDLKRLLAENNYQQVHFISISLGGVPLALVCNKFSDFTGVTAVVGGDDLAVCMWYGLRTQHYRAAFEKMHVGIRRLAKEWDDLGPDHNMRHFKNKPIKLIISLRDKFVGTKYQIRLAHELIDARANIFVKRRLTGHILTITRYCFFERLP